MAKRIRVGIVSDLHGRLLNPSSRKDSYLTAFIQKLNFVLQNSDVVIQLGDWFDKAHTEDLVKNLILDLLNMHNKPVYVVPGNHDIDNDNMETLSKTSLGNIIKHRSVTLLTPEKIWDIAGLRVGVLDYDINVAKNQTFEKVDIIVGHHFYNWERDLSLSLEAKDIENYHSDYVFLGHDHEPHQLESVGNSIIVRMGSMMRKDLNEYTKNHVPSFWILDVENGQIKDVEVKTIPHTPFEDAFRYEEKKVFKKCTKLLSDIKGFLSTIEMKPEAKRTIGKILVEDLKAPKEVVDYLQLVYRVNHLDF